MDPQKKKSSNWPKPSKNRRHNIKYRYRWHEARIPTIATSVPRAAFSGISAQIKEHVSIPVITSNRINTPTIAEEVLGQSRYGLNKTVLSRPLSCTKGDRLKRGVYQCSIA